MILGPVLILILLLGVPVGVAFTLLVMANAADLAAATAAADAVAEAPGHASPQALPRVALQVEARTLPPGHPDHDIARAAYLARFPQAEITFGLADFSLVALQPLSARLVAGFGRAHGLRGDLLNEWLQN